MNLGGYEAERFSLIDFDGSSVGLVVAKVTYEIGEDRIPRVAGEQEPILFAAALLEGDDPALSPVKFEADTALKKPKTDFVVHGTAYAPGGDAAGFFDVEVVVGRHRRQLRVFGPRQAVYRKPSRQTKKHTVYTTPLVSDPTPVKRVPLDFTRAYGGVGRYKLPDSDDVMEIPCPTNPVGKGFCVQNSSEGLDGLELPQVEDPKRLLTPDSLVMEIGAPENVPVPAGFGVFGTSWYPRVAYAGVMPHEQEAVREQVRKQASSLDPDKDAEAIAMLDGFSPPVMAPEFFQGASPGMAFDYLAGDESMTLKNLSPTGSLSFNLPGRRPLVRFNRGNGLSNLEMVLDTVVLQVDEMRLVMVYRGRCILSGPEETDEFPGVSLEIEDVGLDEYERALADD